MPSALGAGYKLDNRTIAPDEEMRRNAHAPQSLIIGMSRVIERIGEKLGHAGAAELTRRETNAMNNDEFDGRIAGPLIAVRRRDERHTVEHPLGVKLHLQ